MARRDYAAAAAAQEELARVESNSTRLDEVPWRQGRGGGGVGPGVWGCAGGWVP